MIHHLHDVKNWVVFPDPLGIRVLVEVKDGNVFVRSSTMLFSGNHNLDSLGEELQLFKENIILDGRIVSNRKSRIPELYDDLLNSELAPERKATLQLCVFDFISTTLRFDQRLIHLKYV